MHTISEIAIDIRPSDGDPMGAGPDHGDDRRARPDGRGVLDRVRTSDGPVADGLRALELVHSAVETGDHALRARLAALGTALVGTSDPLARTMGRLVLAWSAAYRGELARAAVLGATTFETLTAAGMFGAATVHALPLLSFLGVTSGDPTSGLAAVGPWTTVLLDPPTPTRAPALPRHLPDEILGRVLTGDVDRAAALVDWLDGQARTAGRATTCAHAAGGAALVRAARGDLDGSLDAAEDAVEIWSTVPAAGFQQARARLTLGRVQRRHKHRRDARTTLEDAYERFVRLDVPAWAQLARQDLDRVGLGSRGSESRDLSTTERRVALLAVRGASNAEIAAGLFVSEKTVEANLTQTYRKLGIRRRTQLADALGAPARC